jgi:hypothetical protein
VSNLGEISAEMRSSPDFPAEFADFKVGYKYSYAGVFWLDIWTWDGEFCVYKGGGLMDDTSYVSIDKATAAELMGKTEDQIGIPFVYRFPLLLLILGGVAVVGAFVFVVTLVKGKTPEPTTNPAPPPPAADDNDADDDSDDDDYDYNAQQNDKSSKPAPSESSKG